jgi:hypothetical protein
LWSSEVTRRLHNLKDVDHTVGRVFGATLVFVQEVLGHQSTDLFVVLQNLLSRVREAVDCCPRETRSYFTRTSLLRTQVFFRHQERCVTVVLVEQGLGALLSIQIYAAINLLKVLG